MKGAEAIRLGVCEFGVRTRVANRDGRSREMFRLIGERISRCRSKLYCDLDRKDIRYEGR